MTQPTKAAKRSHFLPCIQTVARANLHSFHIVVAVSQQSEYIQPRAAAAFDPGRSRRTGTRNGNQGIDAAFRLGLQRQDDACFRRYSGTLSDHVRPGKVGS